MPSSSSPLPPSATTPLVDHVVVLVPYAFLSAPPAWFAGLFRLSAGGRHADGRTENTLALLADGSYIEFIAFVPGADRAAHHWGAVPEGSVADWSVSLPPAPAPEGRGDDLAQEPAFREVQRRVRDTRAGIIYGDLVRGGRTRPDGTELRWGVAFAVREGEGEGEGVPAQSGTVPFWCLDATPRHLRVPYSEPGAVTQHPTGIVGVARVEVSVSEADAGSARAVYDVLLGPGREAPAGFVREWDIDVLEKSKVHPGGAVRLREAGPGAGTRVEIAFFTDDEGWAGKTVGGRVNDETELVFHLVAVPKAGAQ
ncbi:glyoxalase-like domain-containing protein [Durotheca rogersii]|uniref:glyoxalase-like domain-containing protein n=1 Tax=Durotheca rogersii TaxID=419775 RepID=UPI00221EA15D|nr:glyoxalase-like domain-containing protein [Durotheca rogersii]KAI5859860.1 glyoxalase-like domain-containing protein [Durotheca rogersii]